MSELLQQGCKMINLGKDQCNNAKLFWDKESRKSLILPVRVSYNWKIRRVAAWRCQTALLMLFVCMIIHQNVSIAQ